MKRLLNNVFCTSMWLLIIFGCFCAAMNPQDREYTEFEWKRSRPKEEIVKFIHDEANNCIEIVILQNTYSSYNTSDSPSSTKYYRKVYGVNEQANIYLMKEEQGRYEHGEVIIKPDKIIWDSEEEVNG